MATDINAGLTAAERRQLGELPAQVEALEMELKQAKRATKQVGTVCLVDGASGPVCVCVCLVDGVSQVCLCVKKCAEGARGRLVFVDDAPHTL